MTGFPQIARSVASALISTGFAISRRYPTEEELFLKAIFGDLSPTEAKGCSGYVLSGIDRRPNLDNQNAIRRSMGLAEFEQPPRNAFHDC